jgi:hypothetical protein
MQHCSIFAVLAASTIQYCKESSGCSKEVTYTNNEAPWVLYGALLGKAVSYKAWQIANKAVQARDKDRCIYAQGIGFSHYYVPLHGCCRARLMGTPW